jgi:hypothetical protein
MKPRLFCMILAAGLLFGTAQLGLAAERPSRSQGGHGTVQGHFSHPSDRGHVGVASRPAWHGGFRGPGVAPGRPVVHDRFRGHAGVDTRVIVAPGFWWGDPWWWGPAYPSYAYPDYAAPPVVVPEAPPVYVQQEPPQQPYYWYYCPNPAGYYPYVNECPSGWLTVVPPSTATP